MKGWRTALRIARREAQRAKGRSALVVAMIMLPILALSFAAAAYDMFSLRPEEQVDRRLGAADAELRWESDGPADQSPKTEQFVTTWHSANFRPTEAGLRVL